LQPELSTPVAQYFLKEHDVKPVQSSSQPYNLRIFLFTSVHFSVVQQVSKNSPAKFLFAFLASTTSAT
jgi:hypothetical protein